MKKKNILFISIAVFLGIALLSCARDKKGKTAAGEKEVLYWTCGMHPSINVTPKEYKKGNTTCPICKMDLIPVYSQESKKEEKGVTPTVKLTERERVLAGVATEKVDYRHLMKEIVTAGKIAYDPELTIAEEEYITALDTYGKMLESHVPESSIRAKKLVEQSEYRLQLLGINSSMIDELKETKRVHTNLILPEKTVWAYADIYEFELGGVKEGQQVKVEATAYSGEIFTGKIRAIDPVLNPKTRSIRIRAEIENPQLKLKPDMYAKVTILVDVGNVLSIPKDAVLDTGLRKVVYVDSGKGNEYMMKEVEVGPEATAVAAGGVKGRFYPVIKGVLKDELVVTRANFLIDSQSQLTGSAAAVYGGALEGGKQEKMPAGHQH